MGGALAVFQTQSASPTLKIEDKDLDEKDHRRRNSLAFYITQFVNYEGEDFGPVVEAVMKDKYASTGGKPPLVRHSKFSRIGDAILQGNMKELRNQIFVFFKSINRKYKDQHGGNSILHMVCQEGYYNMLEYIFNPLNRSGLDDDIDLEINIANDRNRIPLFLCFTPPSATAMGLLCGLDPEGNINADQRSELLMKAIREAGGDVGNKGDVSLNDWAKPGGPKSRENCIKLLLKHGADVNARDFHGFTALHFAAMWGWTSTVKLLLNSGADANAQNEAGRTALSIAIENHHDEQLVPYLLSSETIDKFGIKIDLPDVESMTPLLLVIQHETPNLETLKLLLTQGADPDHTTLRKKTPLQLACNRQLVAVINLLLDHNCHRDASAFNLLRDTETLKAATLIAQRLEKDEKKKMEDAARMEREQQLSIQKALQEKQEAGRMRKTVSDAWVEYRDLVTQKPFYYNTITRYSTFEKPKEYKPRKDVLITERRFGLHFYH